PKPHAILVRFAPLTPAASPPKKRLGQAHGLPLPWLPRLDFYAILRHILRKQTPWFHFAEQLRQYQLPMREVLLVYQGFSIIPTI
ncbi:MAG: hypothetical protein ACUVTH_02670, partial [Thermogutta sp.]